MGSVYESSERLVKQASEFTKSAVRTEESIRELTSTAGMAILSLHSDAEYRKASSDFFTGKPSDRYIAARSAHALMSDDAVCLSSDLSRLTVGSFPSARNMISSFLEDMAWDLNERRLITSARNYTTFLVGAARGFEAVIQALRVAATGKERESAARLRVFYLTHTVVAPAHLLNWPARPSTEAAFENSLSCRIHPFMFDYMTYCRYFAAHRKDMYAHGRLIRVKPEQGSDPYELIAKNPNDFDSRAVSGHQMKDYRLPQYCNKWGIPVWRRIALRKGSSVAPLPLYRRDADTSIPLPEIKAQSDRSNDPSAYLFCYIPNGEPGWHAPTSLPREPHSLVWPLYLEEDGFGNELKGDVFRTAGMAPQLDDWTRRLFEFLIRSSKPETSGLLSHYGSRADEVQVQRKELLNRELELFESRIQEIANDWIVQEQKEPLDAADRLLHAFEHLMRAKWGFHGRGEHAGAPAALDLWEDVQTALMMLVNVVLAHDVKGPGELTDFPEWFADTFHSNRELGRFYEDKNLIEEHKKAGGGNPRDLESWAHLAEEEFALIGIIQLPEDSAVAGRDFLIEALGKWDDKDGPIRQIMGLKSSIQVPWKRAELSWYWPTGNGPVELRNMVEFYRLAMSNGAPIAPDATS